MITTLAALVLAAGWTEESALAFVQEHRRVEVAPGITSFVAKESPGGVVQGNISVIRGERASLVIDSGQYPEIARGIVDALAADGTPPVRWLVNTHWHGDHLLANHVFAARWPSLSIVAHAETARLGAKHYANWSSEGIRKTRDYVSAAEAGLARGTTSKGVALTDEQKIGYRTDLALAAQWLAQAEDTRWTPPDVTITDEMRIDLGNRAVVVRKPGNANTPGDLVVFDEATKTLFAGDIVVHPTPYSFGSLHSDWIETLASLRALAPRHLVPGHGEVMRDLGYLEQLEALLAATRSRVREAAAGGATLDEVRNKVSLDDFEQRFAGDDAFRRRAFRQFYVEPGIERAYKEAKGEALVE